MVIRARTIFVACLLFLLSYPLQARSAPISFLYRVEVIEGVGTLLGSFVPTTFSMVATFDDRFTHLELAPDFRAETYGYVTFSPSPLPLFAPSPYPGLPFVESLIPQSTNRFIVSDVEGEWVHFGDLGSFLGQESPHFVGCCFYDVHVFLGGSQRGLATPPILTPL
jgi:hypothetical protein